MWWWWPAGNTNAEAWITLVHTVLVIKVLIIHNINMCLRWSSHEWWALIAWDPGHTMLEGGQCHILILSRIEYKCPDHTGQTSHPIFSKHNITKLKCCYSGLLTLCNSITASVTAWSSWSQWRQAVWRPNQQIPLRRIIVWEKLQLY